MTSILDAEEKRLVRIKPKNVSKPKSAARVPRPGKKKKAVVRSKTAMRSPRGGKTKQPAKFVKSDAKGIKTKGALPPSDAKGIRRKAELGDNLQQKKMAKPVNADNTKPTKGADDQIKPIEKFPKAYLRVAYDNSSGTLTPLSEELTQDTSLLQFEVKPITSSVSLFESSPNSEQGIIWSEF